MICLCHAVGRGDGASSAKTPYIHAPEKGTCSLTFCWRARVASTIFRFPFLPAVPLLPLGRAAHLSTRAEFFLFPQVMLLVFFVTITTYNIFCIYVTAYLRCG